MPLRVLTFEDGCYYHIYNRGVAKQDIFLIRADKLRFLNKLSKCAKKFKVAILGYCLMQNHFHLILKQKSGGSITEFMRILSVSYVMYFNVRHRRVGPLYQGRFKAKLIESDEYLLQLVRYIHQNPQKILPKGFDLKNYEWSSYPTYLGLRKYKFVNTRFIMSYFSNLTSTSANRSSVEAFAKFVEEKFSDEEFDDIKTLTHETGT